MDRNLLNVTPHQSVYAEIAIESGNLRQVKPHRCIMRRQDNLISRESMPRKRQQAEEMALPNSTGLPILGAPKRARPLRLHSTTHSSKVRPPSPSRPHQARPARHVSLPDGEFCLPCLRRRPSFLCLPWNRCATLDYMVSSLSLRFFPRPKPLPLPLEPRSLNPSP